MMHFSNPSPAQPVIPKPRVKKGNRDPVTLVREAARTCGEDFTYFVVTGKLRSTKLGKIVGVDAELTQLPRFH